MKLNAVGVASQNIEESVKFYSLLGFQFPQLSSTDQHIETIPSQTTSKLIDLYAQL